MRRANQGVALITALLITAVVSIIAVSMISRLQIDIRRTSNILDRHQALMFAYGMEEWAKVILIQDAKNNNTDSLKDIWAIPLPPLEVEGGFLGGSLTDLHGRYNLNNLVIDGAIHAEEVARFQRLLTTLEINPDLALAVVDWIDIDQQPQFPGGAEDSDYYNKAPAYRAANVPMQSPSELRLVAGFEAELVNRLLPYVSTLPVGSKININTASPEVLTTLLPGFSMEMANKLVQQREEKTFESIKALLQLSIFDDFKKDNAELEKDLEAAYSTSSDYFLLNSQANFGVADVVLYSRLKRTNQHIITLYRAQGSY